MSILQTDGAKLRYDVSGAGDPVVLVHGGAGDSRGWASQIEALSESYKVINYSRRYHWPNEPIPEGVGDPISVHVDDLEALIGQLDTGPVHLIGHSWGAVMCLMLAMRRPDLVRSEVLEEPPVLTLLVSLPPKPAEMAKLFLKSPGTAVAIAKFGMAGVEPARKAFARGENEAGLHLWACAVSGKKSYSDFSPGLRERMEANSKPLEAAFVRGGLAPLTAADIQKIQTPSLLVNGQTSHPVFHRLNDTLEKVLPHTSRVVIPNASHWMHEDNPGAANRTILDFLAQQA